jgi:Leucine-rich repeat (LRR) protein
MKKTKLRSFVVGAILLLATITNSTAQDFADVCADAEVLYNLNEAIASKDKVQKLDLSMQKIKALSPSIKELQNLECLDLSFNIFSTLPAEIGQLKKLTYLNLTGTRYMARVPAVLKQLPNLKILDLRDHPEWPKAAFEEAKLMLPNVTIITK